MMIINFKCSWSGDNFSSLWCLLTRRSWPILLVVLSLLSTLGCIFNQSLQRWWVIVAAHYASFTTWAQIRGLFGTFTLWVRILRVEWGVSLRPVFHMLSFYDKLMRVSRLFLLNIFDWSTGMLMRRLLLLSLTRSKVQSIVSSLLNSSLRSLLFLRWDFQLSLRFSVSQVISFISSYPLGFWRFKRF